MNKQHKAISKLTGAFEKFIDALDELEGEIEINHYNELYINVNHVEIIIENIVEKYRVKYAK